MQEQNLFRQIFFLTDTPQEIVDKIFNAKRPLRMDRINIFYKPRKKKKKFIEDINLESILYERDFVYPFSENFFFYSYKLFSFIVNHFIYSDYNTLVEKVYLTQAINFSASYSLYLSVMLDQFYSLSILMLPFFNEFYKHFFVSPVFNTQVIAHPELFIIIKNYFFHYWGISFTNIYMSSYSLYYSESNIAIIMIFWQFALLMSLCVCFLLTYFAYFTGLLKSNGMIDHDFVLFFVLVESEEEIGSIDDMLLTCIVLIYIYFWFFWVTSLASIIIISSSLMMVMSLFPLLYFLILFIPFSLLYDYGSYFLTYLNGVGKSFLLIIEMVFDYIAVSIFFLRLTVQNVRLAFMLFTFIELHELILNTSYDKNLLVANDSSSNDLNNNGSDTVVTQDSNYLLLTLPLKILNWLYELFHTFFMLLFQFVAFFAMIFWLFLFLYTMFITEIQENYLTFKRKFRHAKSKLWLRFKST